MFKFARLSSRKWQYIIIHHSQSPDSGKTYSWDEIESWHVKDNGWAQIGYNFGIEKDDKERYIYCIGRGLDCVGAHTYGMNETAIGICVVGDFDIAPPNDIQIWLLSELCKSLMRDFSIPLDNILPHRDFNTQKTCPGKHFDMSYLYNKIKNNGYTGPII
jgi:hypothetical protein